MLLDCVVIGGGPAGLNAALVLGRARRIVTVFDEGKPANAVTHESHGFITRDGVNPNDFRTIAHQEIGKYPSVNIQHTQVTGVSRRDSAFEVTTGKGDVYLARNILLATGLKAILPTIDGIHDYFGKSLFTCPYCDGWELRDKRLVVISEEQDAFHMAQLVRNWSKRPADLYEWA